MSFNHVYEDIISFKIADPKPRDIHKASVRDRLVHHAIYRVVYEYFDRTFIFDSYSCRRKKGVHRAINRFREFGRRVSHNNTRTAWVLQCDIRKFFASIDHTVMLSLLKQHISDKSILWLLEQVISSFQTTGGQNRGLPLGNLTSQLFINIYMNEFDQFMKRKLQTKYYIRYADDFVILNQDKSYLLALIPHISNFLERELTLSLNPKKLLVKTLNSGIDFLGWVHFPHHRTVRTSTKRRMLRKLKDPTDAMLASYLGLLSHGNTHKLKQKVLDL